MYRLEGPMPSSAEIMKALEDFSDAWGSLSSREALRARIMNPSEEDKGLGGVLLILLTAFDVTKTNAKDEALRKLVGLADLGGPEICDQVKAILGGTVS
jgi:hypothetical protein